MPTTIFYNPRCSTCRNTLKILRDRGIEPERIEYLSEAIDGDQLRRVMELAGCRAADLLRKKEAKYMELNVAEIEDDDDAVIAFMIDHPILIQRPIVIHEGRARICRPPETVLELLDSA